MLRENEAPAEVFQDQGEGEREASWTISDTRRSARRQHLSRHLHAAGPRPVLEALLAVDNGQPLDEVLENFGRLPPELYHATLYHYAALSDGGVE